MTLTGSVVVDHFHHEHHDVFPIIGAHFIGMYALVIVVGATVLVVVPALWILCDAAARRRCPRFTNDYPRRTPCTHTSP